MIKRILFFLYGSLSYVLFLGTFLYAIGFIGNFGVPRTLDGAASAPLGISLAIDVLLLTLFAVQHSVMARKWFKEWWTRIVPKPLERSTYVLFSSVALIAMFALWQPLGGVITTGPAVSSWGANRLDIFARGQDNGLWHMSWNGSSWSGWQSLGGVITSDPTAVSWGPNRIDIFARGQDNGLWHMSWNGFGWSAWDSLGGILTSAPDASSCAPGHLDVGTLHDVGWKFGRWLDSVIMQRALGTGREASPAASEAVAR